MVQPCFDYACDTWNPSVKKLKMHLQATQNKCTRFCLKLNDRFTIKFKDFGKINSLPIYDGVSKYYLCSVYRFLTKNFDEIYVPLETNGIHTRSSYQNLNANCRKKVFLLDEKPYLMLVPQFSNNLNKILKPLTGLLAFKHNINQHYFDKLKKKESFTFHALLMFQSKYIHLNLTVYMSYFNFFSFLPFL